MRSFTVITRCTGADRSGIDLSNVSLRNAEFVGDGFDRTIWEFFRTLEFPGFFVQFGVFRPSRSHEP